MKKIIIPVLILFSGCAPIEPKHQTYDAPKPKEPTHTLEEICKTHECRKNRHVVLYMKDQVIDQVIPEYWPVVFNNSISILPGDSLFIEADINKNIISNLKSVPKNTKPERTITFKLTQDIESQGMLLSVKNPFKQPIKFHIDMIDFNGHAHETSSCPVSGGVGLFEHWPYPIPELRVSNLRVIDVEKEGYICAY